MTETSGIDSAPTVLILGGLTTLARPLSLYLLRQSTLSSSSSTSKPLASFVRIADRPSVSPASTYLDRPFLSLLQDPEGVLEYRQVNLANTDRHNEVFEPPDTWRGKDMGWKERGFEVVFDLTGEMDYDKPEIIQISNTHSLSLSLAHSASLLPSPVRPKAYIRLTYSFYEMKSLPSSSPGHSEAAELRPDGVRGRWWHETLRGLGVIREETGLNLACVRSGAWYGPGGWGGEVMPRVVAGHVYQYLKEEMKFLYNSDLRINTIHTTDLSQLLHLLALHLLSHPYSPSSPSSTSSAIETIIPFTFTPSPSSSSSFSLSSLTSSKEKRTSMDESWKSVPRVVPAGRVVKLPLFNAVDDGNATQGELGKAVAEVWGIKYGFLNSAVASLVQQFVKTDFSEMVEDVNEMHVEAWSKMLAASNPPISSTPISPFLDEHAFRKLAICLDGSKARKVLGFKPIHPKVEVGELKAIVKGFQDDGIWPKLS